MSIQEVTAFLVCNVCSSMDVSKSTVRSCLLYDFKSGLSAAESQRRITDAFGDGTVSKTTAKDWFTRFRGGDFNLEDRPRSGRPSGIDDSLLQAAIEANPYQSTRELAERFDVDQKTIFTHLHAMGKVSKFSQWVPHNLSEADRQRRADIAAQLLSYGPTTHWLESIVTGDEKWVLYANITRRRSWVDKGEPAGKQPKQDLHPQKVMLSVWWDCKGVIHFELLPPNTTITAALYCEQLDRVSQAMAEKRPNHGVVRFLHDNARPHTARMTRQRLLGLGWEVLPHPAYSPDLAPTDYHLFANLSQALAHKSFADRDQIDSWLHDWLNSKPEKFFSDGIKCLPQKWQKVLESDGDYF